MPSGLATQLPKLPVNQVKTYVFYAWTWGRAGVDALRKSNCGAGVSCYALVNLKIRKIVLYQIHLNALEKSACCQILWRK